MLISASATVPLWIGTAHDTDNTHTVRTRGQKQVPRRRNRILSLISASLHHMAKLLSPRADLIRRGTEEDLRKAFEDKSASSSSAGHGEAKHQDSLLVQALKEAASGTSGAVFAAAFT